MDAQHSAFGLYFLHLQNLRPSSQTPWVMPDSIHQYRELFELIILRPGVLRIEMHRACKPCIDEGSDSASWAVPRTLSPTRLERTSQQQLQSRSSSWDRNPRNQRWKIPSAGVSSVTFPGRSPRESHSRTGALEGDVWEDPCTQRLQTWHMPVQSTVLQICKFWHLGTRRL